MTNAERTGRLLAKALDNEDYSEARELLDARCRYDFRGETITGADTIIAMYRSNGDAGHTKYDQVVYESEGRVRW